MFRRTTTYGLFSLLFGLLCLGTSAQAITVDAELLRNIERLRQAALWNDSQFFALTLKQSLTPQLLELDEKLKVKSRLQADQVKLQHVLGGLLVGFTVLALDEVLAGDQTQWQALRLLSGQMEPWLADYNAKLAGDWERALTAAQASDDLTEQRQLFKDLRPRLLKIVYAAFDPVEAKRQDREADIRIQPDDPLPPKTLLPAPR